MGYIRHHAIVVVGPDEWPEGMRPLPDIHQAREAALSCGCTVVTEVAGPGVNGTSSFLVGPDGSKEGWEDSDRGDEARDLFIAWLRAIGEDFYSWAEVVLGEDDEESHVERHAWQSKARR